MNPPEPGPPRTRVVVDALSARLGGGLSYVISQLTALEQVAPELDLRVLAAPENVEALRANLRSPVSVVRGGALRPVIEQLVLPVSGGRDQVLYCPGNFAPLLPSRMRVVLTIQNPNYFGTGRRAPHNRSIDRRVRSWLSRWSVRRADRVVVISQALLDELRLDLPGAARTAALIPSGAPRWPDGDERPPSLPEHCEDFILSLANDAPHKNLDVTIEAWSAAFADAADVATVPALVLAGRCFDDARPGRQRALVPHRLRARFVQLGGVTDRRQVMWLLRHARVMVSSASLEAHPLTPAEAGSLGCPLVLSDIPAHREVAGDNATFVPVGDAARLRAALVAIDTRVDRPWAGTTSWDDNARKLAAVLLQAAEGGP